MQNLQNIYVLDTDKQQDEDINIKRGGGGSGISCIILK